MLTVHWRMDCMKQYSMRLWHAREFDQLVSTGPMLGKETPNDVTSCCSSSQESKYPGENHPDRTRIWAHEYEASILS